MKFTRFPLLALALSGLAATSQAQVSSQTYRSVDAYGNAVRTTVRTPLADQPSIAGVIAGQGVLGANTTTSSSTVIYGNGYGNYYNGYGNNGYGYAPSVVYNQPVYPYPYGYYGNAVNNYYYPQVPTTGPIAPANNSWSRPAWATNIPIGNNYSYGGSSYPYNYGGYYDGAGYGSIVTQGNTYSTIIGVQVGGARNSNRNDRRDDNRYRDNRYRDNRTVRRAPSVLTNPPPILPPGVRPNPNWQGGR